VQNAVWLAVVGGEYDIPWHGQPRSVNRQCGIAFSVSIAKEDDAMRIIAMIASGLLIAAPLAAGTSARAANNDYVGQAQRFLNNDNSRDDRSGYERGRDDERRRQEAQRERDDYRRDLDQDRTRDDRYRQPDYGNTRR
jgi:hypothetical protein